MAFETNAQRNSRHAATVVGQDQSWKAQAFINVFVPTADGQGRIKVSDTGLALKLSRKNDAAIIKRLTEGGEEAVKSMLSKMTIEFRMVDENAPAAEVGF